MILRLPFCFVLIFSDFSLACANPAEGFKKIVFIENLVR